MAKKIEKIYDPNELFKAELEEINDGQRTLADGVTRLYQNGIRAQVPQEELNKIRQTIDYAMLEKSKEIKLPLPDMSLVVNKICEQVIAKLDGEIDKMVSRALDNRSAKIEVEHRHHHTKMYGFYASSEKNRKVMIILTAIIVVLFLIIIKMLMSKYGYEFSLNKIR